MSSAILSLLLWILTFLAGFIAWLFNKNARFSQTSGFRPQFVFLPTIKKCTFPVQSTIVAQMVTYVSHVYFI